MAAGATRRRVLGLLLVGLLAAGAGVAAHAAGLLGWLERSSVDARFSLRGSRAAPSDLVVVGVDNDSVGALPRYPFSRALHARVIEHLHEAGARLIVYDISFDRPTTEAADLALLRAARLAAPVIFATSLISPSGETEVLGGGSNLASIGDEAAAAQLTPDSDGVLRHTLGEVSGLPTIAAAAAARMTGRAPSARQPGGGWIDFPGPPGTVRNLSFLSVLEDHFNPSSVRGKVVVVGATASSLQDLHSTAAGSPMSGPEVQADAIATVLAGFPLRSPSGVITVLLIALLGVAAPLLRTRFGTLASCAAGLALILAWSLSVQLAFNAGAVLDFSDPLAALLIGTVGTLMFGIWVDDREHRRLRSMFAADAGGVVEQVLHDPGERSLAPTGVIAGYRIEEIIGRGGMGVVYRASQLALERPVAIKLIATERAEDPAFRERFKAESRIAASIEHANVIPVYDAGEDDGLLFIAMRFVHGCDLGDLLDRAGALTPERATRVITQIAGALDAAHARGLVHRDVKPGNVLLTLDEPEHAYLTDFGVAMQLGTHARITRVGQWVGTLDYLAPEQIRGEAIGPGADIYALTGVLHHCLTGETPFPLETDAAIMWAHQSAPPPRPAELWPHLPQEIDEVIVRGMAKDPAERFRSAGELASACARALGLIALTPPPAPPARRAPAVQSPFRRTTPAGESARTTPSGEVSVDPHRE
jgi:serine/threonine protein kinase/CHASE2 domain-containing sensor protein